MLRSIIGLLMIFLCCIGSCSFVYAWSSLDAGGAMDTHQYLCDEAYDKLERHPALKYIKFPSRAKIREHSTINTSQQGKGPDNPNNSSYDEHYYNPRINKGAAPKSVQRDYDGLTETLRELNAVRNDSSHKSETEKLTEDSAHYAAYAAHFIQDMNCSFHVNGMPLSMLDRDKVPGFDYTGPYRQTYTPELWKKLADQALSVNDEKMNWFDPVYYDGPEVRPVMGSTHFVYEGLIEWKFFKDLAHLSDYIAADLNAKYVSPVWRKGMSMEKLAIAHAKLTQEKLDSKHPQYYFSAEEFQKQMSEVQQNMLGDVDPETGTPAGELNWWTAVKVGVREFVLGDHSTSKSIFNVLSNDVQAPYEAWARSIQATYTLWRASFSALIIRPEDVRLRKVAGKTDAYEVQVRVTNVEADDYAYNVKFKYEAKIGSGKIGKGTGSLGSGNPLAPDTESKWVTLSGVLKIPDLEKIDGEPRVSKKNKGRIRLAAKGEYKNVPDSGLNIFEFDLDELTVLAYQLYNVEESARVNAIDRLKAQSKDFKIIEIKGERAPLKHKEFTVQKQEPAAKTWVASDEKIKLTVFDFGPIEINGVVKQATLVETDGVWKFGPGAGVEKTPLPGATIRIQFEGIEKHFISKPDGTFSFLFGDKPVSKDNTKVKVRVTRDGYQPFKQEMSFSHQAEWEILMKSAEKAVVDVKIENVKREMSSTSIPWANWEYDIVFKPRNVGICLVRQKIVDQGQACEEEDLHPQVAVAAGEEDRVRQRTFSNYNTSLQANDRTVTFYGEDFNGNPIEITVAFPQDMDEVLQAEAEEETEDQGFSDDQDWHTSLNEYVEAQNQNNNEQVNFEDLAPLPPEAFVYNTPQPIPVPVKPKPAVAQPQVNTRNNTQQKNMNDFLNTMSQTMNTIKQMQPQKNSRKNNNQNTKKSNVKSTNTFVQPNYIGKDKYQFNDFQIPGVNVPSKSTKTPSKPATSAVKTPSKPKTKKTPKSDPNEINLLELEAPVAESADMTYF